MDKKKKMIVVAVGLGMAGLLVLILTSLFAEDDSKTNNFFSSTQIRIPEVNMDKIKQESKIASYEAENKKNPFKIEEIKPDKVEVVEPSEKPTIPTGTDELTRILELQKIEEEKQKKFLEKLQAQYRNSNQQNNNSFALESFRRKPASPAKAEPAVPVLSKEEQEEKLLSGNAFNGAKFNSGNTDRFYGAPTTGDSSLSKQLVSAEIADRTIITQGSTVAIRLLESAYIPKLGIKIPKDAVLYGIAKFNSKTRMSLKINSYKFNNTFYKTKITVYDFDGRPGIHLDNNSWPKIPAKVAKDVAEVALQRAAAVQNQFGTVQPLTTDQAKDLAVISGARYVTDEMFQKRKVMLPRQYNIWLEIGD